jgi:6-phosphofructokinase 1
LPNSSRASSATSITGRSRTTCKRAARHIASKVDVEQAYAVGKAAVELALKGHNSVMPTIVRVSDKPYRWKIGLAKLEDVANKEKMLPPRLHHGRRLSHHAKGRRYLRATDPRRGLSAIQGRVAAVRRAAKRPVKRKVRTPFAV